MNYFSSNRLATKRRKGGKGWEKGGRKEGEKGREGGRGRERKEGSEGKGAPPSPFLKS